MLLLILPFGGSFRFFLRASLGWYLIVLLIGTFVGTTMAAATGKLVENAGTLLGWILVPIFALKDCVYRSIPGKCNRARVQVIDEATGEPGGIGASFK